MHRSDLSILLVSIGQERLILEAGGLGVRLTAQHLPNIALVYELSTSPTITKCVPAIHRCWFV